MSWFRRAGRPTEPTDPQGQQADAPEETDEERAEREAAAAAERAELARRAALEDAEAVRAAKGPLDESDVTDDVTRIDLGALRIPPREGMELRLEIEDSSQRVIAATVTLAGSSVQLQAFAAPRRDGVWDDIRTEIAAQVTRQGGTADEIPGTFGREVLARIPARTADGRTGHQVARFTGVDGPRWFLRAVFHGEAAVDEKAAADLEDVVRGTVVVRGSEARPPRDLLALKLPAQPPGAAAAEGVPGAEAAPDEQPTLDPLRRGPEITEIR